MAGPCLPRVILVALLALLAYPIITHAGASVRTGDDGSLSGWSRPGSVSGTASHNNTNANAAIAPKARKEMR